MTQENGRVNLAVRGDMSYRVAKALESKGHPALVTREELFAYLHPERFNAYRRPETGEDRNIRWQITTCMKRMPGYRLEGGADNPRFRRVDAQ